MLKILKPSKKSYINYRSTRS